MRVPDQVLSACGFIAARRDDGKPHFLGTAFFVSRRVRGQEGFAYTVTAAHVIEKALQLGLEAVYVRVNSREPGRSIWMIAPMDQWLFHPSDSACDVAVYRGGPPWGVASILTVPLSNLRRQQQLADEGIGIGTDIFVSGLFRHHIGDARNETIVRTGNLAALPAELIQTKRGAIPGYLIEARSIGGLSGAPVFAHLGDHRVVDGHVQTSSTPVFFLIGLMHGHFQTGAAEIDAAADSTDSPGVHAGVGVVVRADEILTVIEQPLITQAEAEKLLTIVPPSA
jgi:hypothetical protein